MDINIAFDTIIYILIFVFPGLLFRKSVFIKEHSKQFHQGNLLERSLFMIFLSLIMIFITVLFVFALKKVFEIKLIDSFSINNLYLIVDTIVNDNIPKTTDKDFTQKIEIFRKVFFDLVTIMSLVYIISIVLGYLVYLSLNSNWFNKLGIVRVNNYWESIIKGSYKFAKDNGTKYIRTDADILFNDGEKKIIYSGEIQDYFLSSKEYQLETIILKNPKIKENGFYKEIPGHNFCIDKQNILNINLSYIYIKIDNSSKHKIIDSIFSVLYIILIAGSLIITYKEYDNIHFNYLFERIFFGITTFIVSSIILNILQQLFKRQLSLKVFINNLLVIFLFGLSFFWLFEYFSTLKVLFFQIIIALIIIKINPIKNDKNNLDLNEESTKNDD